MKESIAPIVHQVPFFRGMIRDRILEDNPDAAREFEAMESYVGSLDFCAAVGHLQEGAPTLPPHSPDDQRVLYGIALWLSMGVPDTFPIALFPVDGDPRVEFALAYSVTKGPLEVRAAIQLAALESGTPAATLARLAFWILDNPDLVEKKPRDLRSKVERRQRNKSRPDRPRLVTVVDLRAAHREAAADVARAEGTYRSRWIVRRHWHNYWVGSGEDRHLEPRVVMPYVKGPAGAPLNVTERVKKW